jgi:hypothetical protein
MAKHVLWNASIVVNGTDLSDHVKQISYVEGLNGVDAAAMSEVQDYGMPSTIIISDITVTYFQDFASSKVYQIHHPLVANRSTFNITVKADSGANATANPAFTIAVFVKTAPFVTGSRGDGHMVQVVYGPAGVQAVATS